MQQLSWAWAGKNGWHLSGLGILPKKRNTRITAVDHPGLQHKINNSGSATIRLFDCLSTFYPMCATQTGYIRMAGQDRNDGFWQGRMSPESVMW
jgi:hypothetical protein